MRRQIVAAAGGKIVIARTSGRRAPATGLSTGQAAQARTAGDKYLHATGAPCPTAESGAGSGISASHAAVFGAAVMEHLVPQIEVQEAP